MVTSFLHLDRESLGSFELLRIVGNISLNKARLSAPGSPLTHIHRLAQL